MKVCVTCGSFVRHWKDKNGVTYYQCQGCNKTWEEKTEETKVSK